MLSSRCSLSCLKTLKCLYLDLSESCKVLSIHASKSWQLVDISNRLNLDFLHEWLINKIPFVALNSCVCTCSTIENLLHRLALETLCAVCLVVSVDNRVKKGGILGVGVPASSEHSKFLVWVPHSRQDGLDEWCKLGPNILMVDEELWRTKLCQVRIRTGREHRIDVWLQ